MNIEQAIIIESVKAYNADLAEAVRRLFEHGELRLNVVELECGELREQVTRLKLQASVSALADDNPLGIDK